MVSLAITTLSALSVALSPTKPDSLRMTTDTFRIKEITVIGGIPNIFSLPTAETDKKVINASPFFTPADALRNHPGISVSRDGVWATSVNIRGLSEQRLLLLSDGDRIQSATDVAGALSTVSLSGLEKIEVIKGAGSVLYGTGAMGGAINFVSARPDYNPTLKLSGELTSGLHSVNGLSENNLLLNFSNKLWYIGLNGSFRTAGNTQSGAGIINGSQFNDASWGLKGGVKYSENKELLVNYQHFGAWNTGIPEGNGFPSTASVRYKKIERNQLSGEYILTDVGDYISKISIKAYTQNISRDVEVINNPTSSSYPKTRLYPSSRNNTSGIKVTSNWELSDNQTLIAGAEGWQRNAITSRLKVAIQSDTTSTITGEQPVANARMMDIGAFAHYSWKIIPAKLILNAGVRLDYIRTKNDSAFNPVFKYTIKYGKQKDATPAVRTLLFPSKTVPEMAYAAHVDLQYNLTLKQSLALSVANSYRAASIEERYKYIDLGSNAPLKVGNPDLKPEQGFFSNLSYTLNSKRIFVRADIFANYLFDLIAEGSGTYLDRPALINTNISRAFFTGAECQAEWKIIKTLTLETNAAYTNGRDVLNKTSLPQIPPFNGLIAMHYNTGKLMNASISAEWSAAKKDTINGVLPTQSFVVFNADIHTRAIPAGKTELQFFAGVHNLLNTAYYDYLTSARSGGSRFYEPGRNIWIRAKWMF